MVTDEKILELANKICSIMRVDFEDVVSNKKKHNALTKGMCMHFATTKLGASINDISRVFQISNRGARYARAKYRYGIERDPYYREPYELIEKGLSE